MPKYLDPEQPHSPTVTLGESDWKSVIRALLIAAHASEERDNFNLSSRFDWLCVMIAQQTNA